MFSSCKDVTIVFAAAGCGKTTHLHKKILAEVKTNRHDDIAFVSFTRKGVEQGKKQVLRSLSIDAEDLPFFRTLNSITFQALGYKSENIFNKRHANKLNELIGSNITLVDVADSASEDDVILNYYNAVRAGYSEKLSEEYVPDMIKYERLVAAYETYKRKNRLVDYVDCFIKFVQEGKPLPVTIAIMDEAQDFSLLHWQVCAVAFARAEKIIIAGDDYQSIYTYSGARPDILIDLASKHPVIKREISYRLPIKVYNYARAVTALLAEKVDKDYKPFKDIQGTIEKVPDIYFLVKKIEARQKENWLVLFRNNCFIASFSSFLLSSIIPYRTSAGFCIDEKELQKIKRYYNFRLHGYSNENQKSIFASTYEIKDFSLPFSHSLLIEEDRKVLVEAYIEKYGIDYLLDLAAGDTGITLSTVHKAKGAESKNVVLFTDCTRKVHLNRLTDIDSELRLLYVAVTRAEENLYLTNAGSKYNFTDIIELIEETQQC